MNKKAINYLNFKCNQYKISKRICYGIYMIETSYRNAFFRLMENSAVIVGIIINYFFKKPLKNRTIGCCQLGIASILYLSGFYRYEHILHIKDISRAEIKIILKAMHYKTNIDLFCRKILNYYTKYSYLSDMSERDASRIIGHLYNGKYIYGLKLQEMVSLSLKNDCSYSHDIMETY